MDITKGKLKQIIKEEMDLLAATGDISLVTESEKKIFQSILEKLTPEQLQDLGLKRVK